MSDAIKIRHVERGEVVTEPGFYSIPIDWHHSDCCDGPSISSSGLRKIAMQTPLHFWNSSCLNPDREPEDDSELEADHFRLGRAAHMLLLEPREFATRIAIRPAEWDSWRTKVSKQWLEARQAEGMTILTLAERDKAMEIAETLRKHPWHSAGILGGLTEITMVTRDEKTGLWLKSRPDAIPLEDAFTDLKVCREADPESVNRSIARLGYDIQMALGGICFEKLTTRTIDTFWIVAIEASKPHAIHVASIAPARTYWARIKIRKALDTLRECLDSGVWPSYGADGQPADMSQAEQEHLDRLQRSGLLPADDDF